MSSVGSIQRIITSIRSINVRRNQNMATINRSHKWLEDFFGGDLRLRCHACGNTFKNEEEFMKHEHKEESDAK